MKKMYWVIMVCIAAGFISGCKEKEAASAVAPLVQVTKAVKMDISIDSEYPAQVVGSKDVDVRAQVGGILKKKFFKEGDYVQEGQQLFLIDPTQYEIDLKRARGSLAQAQSDMRRTKRDYERMKALFKENAVSRKDNDDALSAYETAQANVQVAQSGVDDAQTKLDYTKVFAPISGITRNDKYSEGNLISTAGEASFLVNIIQIDPLEVHFSIPSNQWNALIKVSKTGRFGMTTGRIGDGSADVEVIKSDGSPYPEMGKMKFVDSSEDPQTGSIFAKATIPNPNHKREILPGQFVKVILRGMRYTDAVIIPPSALLSTAKGNMVYVLNDQNVATLKPVSAIFYKDYAVVTGLEGGERVVSSGVVKVKPNMAVTPELTPFDVTELQIKEEVADVPAPAAVSNDAAAQTVIPGAATLADAVNQQAAQNPVVTPNPDLAAETAIFEE